MGWGICKLRFDLAARAFLPQHHRAALIKTNDVKRIQSGLICLTWRLL
jgi:hypothetical protein